MLNSDSLAAKANQLGESLGGHSLPMEKLLVWLRSGSCNLFPGASVGEGTTRDMQRVNKECEKDHCG